MANKYFNIRTTVGDRTFDSRGESERYVFLKACEDRGEISNLRCQVTYPLAIVGINSVNCGSYRADFVYERLGQRVVEDFKGIVTDLYKLKKKLVFAIHNVRIIEIFKPNDPLKSLAQLDCF